MNGFKTNWNINLLEETRLQVCCSYSESQASRRQHGVWVQCIVGHCHAAPFPATSQVGTRLPAATWRRRSIALKPVMHCSLVIARAFNWHISLLTAHPYCLLLFKPFFKLRMPRFLVVKCPTITIFLKSHFIFCGSHKYNFRSHRTFFPLHGFQCFPLLQLS